MDSNSIGLGSSYILCSSSASPVQLPQFSFPSSKFLKVASSNFQSAGLYKE